MKIYAWSTPYIWHQVWQVILLKKSLPPSFAKNFTMASNGAPDNWDDEDMDVSNKLNALNVNAPAFVPNVNAPVFVPGNWGGSTPEEAPKTAPTSAPTNTQADNGMQVDNPSPVGNGPGKPAADSWEDKADMSSSATTPEDEEMSMEDDTGKKEMFWALISPTVIAWFYTSGLMFCFECYCGFSNKK